jgi:D-arabinose 1-dehydrogenase-like Zn-dependent alcohol dehydrogenase
MKALVFHRPKHVEVNDVPDPKLEHAQDVILRVTASAICGSDLHIYNGFFPQVKDLILGHEFMGVVEDVGRDVTKISRGDRVVVPFPVACGACFFCQRDLPGHCQNSNPKHYGPEGALLSEKGGGLFGYTDLYGGYSGGQAEYVRVPYANFGPRKVSDNFQDEEVLFLTDIFPTGYSAIDWAGVKGGETVAVFGCGPVGLMAQKVAWLRGAKRVIGVDIQEYRLTTARKTAKSETHDQRPLVQERRHLLPLRRHLYGCQRRRHRRFQGLMRRLDYLHGLGITAIWLMPFQTSPGKDDGYDVSDYYGVDPRYGTLGDFVEFTHGAKQRGIRVLIDLVVNHTSNEHPWFKEARKDPNRNIATGMSGRRRSRRTPTRAWCFPACRNRPGRYDKEAKAWYFHRFYDFQPDLNTSNPRCRPRS